MRKEQAPQAVQVSLGDVQIEATPPTAGEQRSRRLESAATSMTIPGGGHYVQVKHIDYGGGEINVNGEPLTYNDSWSAESRDDRVSNTVDFTAAVTISNPGGARFAVRVDFPSSSSFDPFTL